MGVRFSKFILLMEAFFFSSSRVLYSFSFWVAKWRVVYWFLFVALMLIFRDSRSSTTFRIFFFIVRCRGVEFFLLVRLGLVLLRRSYLIYFFCSVFIVRCSRLALSFRIRLTFWGCRIFISLLVFSFTTVFTSFFFWTFVVSRFAGRVDVGVRRGCLFVGFF